MKSSQVDSYSAPATAAHARDDWSRQAARYAHHSHHYDITPLGKFLSLPAQRRYRTASLRYRARHHHDISANIHAIFFVGVPTASLRIGYHLIYSSTLAACLRRHMAVGVVTSPAETSHPIPNCRTRSEHAASGTEVTGFFFT